MEHTTQGLVIGVPGAGLTGTPSWAANADVARIGREGELRTAALLNAAARRFGFTVLHDLRIPLPGVSANVDHVVVSGSKVLLIDAKVWRPGLYWTVAGRTFRGPYRFAPADKKTMAMAHRAFETYLGRTTSAAPRLVTPRLVIWPSRTGTLRTALLRVPGASVIPACRLQRTLARFARRRRPADPRIVAAMVPLVAAHQSVSDDARRAT